MSRRKPGSQVQNVTPVVALYYGYYGEGGLSKFATRQIPDHQVGDYWFDSGSNRRLCVQSNASRKEYGGVRGFSPPRIGLVFTTPAEVVAVAGIKLLELKMSEAGQRPGPEVQSFDG